MCSFYVLQIDVLQIFQRMKKSLSPIKASLSFPFNSIHFVTLNLYLLIGAHMLYFLVYQLFYHYVMLLWVSRNFLCSQVCYTIECSLFLLPLIYMQGTVISYSFSFTLPCSVHLKQISYRELIVWVIIFNSLYQY